LIYKKNNYYLELYKTCVVTSILVLVVRCLFFVISFSVKVYASISTVQVIRTVRIRFK